MELLIVLAVFVVLIYVAWANRSKLLAAIKQAMDETNPPVKARKQAVLVDHKKKTYLTTENERKLYFALQKALTSQYMIHCQVPLIALVEPPYQYRTKSWAKRLDFVITDTASKIIAVIELDDASHNRKDRVERDNYVNYALKGHHPLIRLPTEKFYAPEKIAELLATQAGIANQFTTAKTVEPMGSV